MWTLDDLRTVIIRTNWSPIFYALAILFAFIGASSVNGGITVCLIYMPICFALVCGLAALGRKENNRYQEDASKRRAEIIRKSKRRQKLKRELQQAMQELRAACEAIQ